MDDRRTMRKNREHRKQPYRAGGVHREVLATRPQGEKIIHVGPSVSRSCIWFLDVTLSFYLHAVAGRLGDYQQYHYLQMRPYPEGSCCWNKAFSFHWHV